MKADRSGPANIDEYIAACPSEVQAILEHIRKTIRQAAPEAEEAIKYQMPTFVLHGNLIHFAAYKKHIGMYPPVRDPTLKVEVAIYEGEKGALRFPFEKSIPLDLIGRIVKARVKENMERAEAKAENSWP